MENNIISEEFLGHWPLLLLAIGAAVLVHAILYFPIKRWIIKDKDRTSSYAFKKMRNPALVSLIWLSLTITYNTLNLPPEEQAVLNQGSTILLIITVAWWLSNGVKIGIAYGLEDSDITVKDNLEARKKLTRFRVLERLVIAIILVIAVGAILMTFDRIKNIGTSLLASAGVAGIIIGFAAQRSIATFLAGIQIALTQPIRLEDAVVVEGEWGWIEEITFTYVVIRIWDRRRLIVPINYFIENPFQNWTRNSADILGPVVLYTDYRVPVSEIREELDRILSNTDLWNGDVKVVQVVDTTEKTVIVRILVSGADSPTTWDLRVHVREKMVEFLTNNYPESLPHSRIELRGGLKPDEN